MHTFGTQVSYKGVELKSKHERSWARFWDRAALSWQYEPTIFRAGRESYTPDFLVNHIYIEIKTHGATRLNKFHFCPAALLLIFGLPDRHYIHFKPAGSTRFQPTHYTHWNLAYQKALV